MDRPLQALKRPATLLLAAVLLLSSAFAGPTAAADDRKAATANSSWLAKQLTADGTLENPLGGALPDHGLMIDTLYAMYASGDGKLAKPIADYLDTKKHATDYYTWDGLVPDMGYDAIITAGSAAKVLVAAEVSGRDPHNFGGHDMVAEVQGTIAKDGRDKGRVIDYSKNPDFADFVSNNANMFGQALAVIGLAGAHANDQSAIDALLAQQCSEGFFRIFFGYTQSENPDDVRLTTCDEGKALDQSAPDGDTTGFALSAMLSARNAGATGLDEPIQRTVAWLKAHQTAGGGWGGGVSTEAPNTNSTGLIVQALAQAGGADDAVAKGTAYLKSAEVTSADANTALADDVGAIAYTPEQYQDARTDGISGTDTWIRASAQASLGLSQASFWDLTQGTVPQNTGGGNGGGTNHKPTTAGGKHTTAPPATHHRAGGQAPPPHSAGGTPVVPAKVTTEPGTATPNGKLARYLAGHLVDGDHVEVKQDGKNYVDYDATADMIFALRSLGEQPQAVSRASAFLLDPKSIAAYAHGVPYEKQAASYAEPLAKLAVIARFTQAGSGAPKDITATLTKLNSDLAALRTVDGGANDTGQFADHDATTTRQAWVAAATTADPASGPAAAASVDRLLDRQCTDGTFALDAKSLTANGTRCATGDLTATAAALTAINAQPRAATVDGVRAEQAPAAGNVVPAAWTSRRSTALTSAAAALTVKVDAQGLVHGADNAVDLRSTAAVATGRQVVGLDVSTTSRATGALLTADGGLPAAQGKAPDLTLSIAAAPAIAGTSWTSASGSPITAAVRLPLPQQSAVARPAAAESSDSGGISFWTAAGFVVLGIALAGAAWVGVHYFTHRKTTTKAVAP